MNILNRKVTLKLNAAWQAIDSCTVAEALNDIWRGSVKPVSITYLRKDDGSIDFDRDPQFNACTWEEWITLPVEEHHLYIQSARQQIRVPTITVCCNFNRMPQMKVSVTNKRIWERDGGICQYTNVPLTKATGNLDHVIPRDKGGKDTFENLVLCHKDVNTKKGNRYNHEVGLKLIRKPRAPLPIPACARFKEVKHPDWKHFLYL